MSYLALYRKFRPKTFQEVVGQEHISKILQNQIENDRVGHAYLFTGPRGTGKTSFAKIFAKAVNCLNPIDGSPCGECEICREKLDNLDIIEIDAASNNRVDEIRDLKEKVSLAPTFAKYKVYIIDEVHMLTDSAFNALLKTLEEPPSYVIFILATTEVQKLPATILSRCIRFDFKLLSTKEIFLHIKKIYNTLQFKATDDSIYMLAKAGEGSMRDALSVADMAMDITNDTLEKEDVERVLGCTKFEKIHEIVQNILEKNDSEVMILFSRLLKEGKTTSLITKDIIDHLREILWSKITCEEEKGLIKEEIQQIHVIAEKFPVDVIAYALELFVEAEGKYRFSVNPRIIFEMTVFKSSSQLNLLSLSRRVEGLEKVIHNLNVDNLGCFPQCPPKK